MPKIDHRVSQAFQGVMQSTDPLESEQQTLEFIFPCKDTLNGIKSLLEDRRIEQSFGASLWSLSATMIFINVWYHTSIKNGLAIITTIVSAIQADNGLSHFYAYCSGRTHHFRQCCFE